MFGSDWILYLYSSVSFSSSDWFPSPVLKRMPIASLICFFFGICEAWNKANQYHLIPTNQSISSLIHQSIYLKFSSENQLTFKQLQSTDSTRKQNGPMLQTSVSLSLSLWTTRSREAIHPSRQLTDHFQLDCKLQQLTSMLLRVSWESQRRWRDVVWDRIQRRWRLL